MDGISKSLAATGVRVGWSMGPKKIIEKISSIVNIHGLTGNSYNVRSKRKTVVKDSIDIILNHNLFLKNNYLSNRDKSLVEYGLNKTLSNLFYFELDNSIFVYPAPTEALEYKIYGIMYPKKLALTDNDTLPDQYTQSIMY